MAIFKVSKAGIDNTPIDELGGLAHNVSQSMFVLNTSTFSKPKPITQIAMGLIITDFNDKRSAYKQGGLAAKKPYETAHKNLLECLMRLEMAPGRQKASLTKSILQVWLTAKAAASGTRTPIRLVFLRFLIQSPSAV